MAQQDSSENYAEDGEEHRDLIADLEHLPQLQHCRSAVLQRRPEPFRTEHEAKK